MSRSYPPGNPKNPGPPGYSQSAGPRPIRLTTNSFEITTLPDKPYYQYDVFSPEEKIRYKRIQLFHHLQTIVAPQIFHPRAIYDGRAIAYVPAKLRLANNGNGTFSVQLGTTGPVAPGSRGVYEIRLSLTVGEEIHASHVNDLIKNRQSTTRALVATNLIQLVIRQGPNLVHTNNGRAYFTDREKHTIARSGIELWRGIFQSVRPSLGRMILTIDTCTAAVYESGAMINVALKICGFSNVRQLELRSDNRNFKVIEGHLKKLRLTVQTGKGKSRTKTIHALVEAAGEYTFNKDGEEITVARHFQEAHGIRIQYPRIIGVRLTGRNAKQQDIVPLELCTILPGQLYRKKLPEEYTSDMVRFATMKPRDRYSRILAGVSTYRNSEFVIESGMRVDTNPIGVDAKLLSTPEVLFKNSRADLKNGGWNVLRQNFSSSARLDHWVVVDFTASLRDDDLRRLTSDLAKSCVDLGMAVAEPHLILEGRDNDMQGSLEAIKHRLLQKFGQVPDQVIRMLVVIVILPDSAGHIRSAVKYWGDVLNGIHTQCLRRSKVKSANNQYWNNIALKLNGRLGGRNFYSVSNAMKKLKSSPYMIMGADVGHPGPGVQKPSVVGIVYSHDEYATQYVAITDIQPPRVEEILSLNKHVFTAVRSFGQKNKVAPRHLIFFRDGLSEGEFERTAQKEIKEIKAGLDELWRQEKLSESKPLLTYVIVGKRHHAVFFPQNERDADRTGNCPAGSLIDGGVTHPVGKDFYLQSHAAIQGTCRSSHYTVLLDEYWNLNRPDSQPWYLVELQELAYTLCHVYAKATRSVSIPAPVYYADLVCSRGAFHVQPGLQLSLDDSASVASGSSNPTVDMNAWEQAFKPINDRLRYSMYFL